MKATTAPAAALVVAVLLTSCSSSGGSDVSPSDTARDIANTVGCARPQPGDTMVGSNGVTSEVSCTYQGVRVTIARYDTQQHLDKVLDYADKFLKASGTPGGDIVVGDRWTASSDDEHPGARGLRNKALLDLGKRVGGTKVRRIG